MANHREKKVSIKDDIIFLFVKIVILVLIFIIAFLFIFGIHRCCDDTMSPAIKNGDLAFYYRLQKDYQVSDVVVLKKGNKEQIRRIIAKSGDVVDITNEGLKVNGYIQQEVYIYTETLPYEEGIKFPITLGQDEYFVLADNRTNSEDSRIYGTVKKENIKGILMTFLRRRGF